MFYVRTNDGVKIAVYDLNPTAAETVFLVHGWPLSHRNFEYQETPLICKGYRVVEIDLRGFGSSDKPACGYTYDRMADDIYAVVRALNLQNFTLAGYSMGGAIVLRYMADLARVCVPTGVFHGRQDRVVPFDLALVTQQGIRNAVLYPFDQSGHGIFYDELDRFNSCFLQFLAC